MLINFRVSNFLSFNEEAEFSMLKGKSKQLESHVVSFGEGNSAVHLLKFGVLYGANASGKSNWVNALDLGKKMIVAGLRNTHFLPAFFKLDPLAKDRASKFEFEFVAPNEKSFAYGFEVILDKKQIVAEWLYELKKTTDKPLFERKLTENGDYEVSRFIKFTNKEDNVRFDVYATDVASDELLLTTLGTKNWSGHAASLEQVYNWFNQQLLIVHPTSKFQIFSMDEKHFPNYVSHLKRFNTGIVDLEIEAEKAEEVLSKLPADLNQHIISELEKGTKPVLSFGDMLLSFMKSTAGEIVVRQLLTKHIGKDGAETAFSLQDESDGTKRLLDLIPLLQVSSHDRTTIVIDEIDRSLHPEISRDIIKIVATLSEGVANQFIVTTHESSLLDLDLLRRDEIWFVEKNNEGESRLYSLEEYKPRFDKELRRAYLQGRFGAIPFIANPVSLGWEKQKPAAYAEG